MGLDIYTYHIKKSIADKYCLTTESEPYEFIDALKEEQKKKFKRGTTKMLKELRSSYKNSSSNDYRQTYKQIILKLAKSNTYYKKWEFKLEKLGYDPYTKTFKEIKTPDEVENVFNFDLAHYFVQESAYFRKVNFLYKYYSEIMKDESCIVSKQDIEELIKTCENVLSHIGNVDYAIENLPTTGGFFFGSTEYNNYYWEDVNDCLNQMKKLHKAMGNEDFALWSFSW